MSHPQNATSHNFKPIHAGVFLMRYNGFQTTTKNPENTEESLYLWADLPWRLRREKTRHLGKKTERHAE